MMAYLDGEGLTADLLYCPVCVENEGFEIEII
jgi:hypothetical protein